MATATYKISKDAFIDSITQLRIGGRIIDPPRLSGTVTGARVVNNKIYLFCTVSGSKQGKYTLNVTVDGSKKLKNYPNGISKNGKQAITGHYLLA